MSQPHWIESTLVLSDFLVTAFMLRIIESNIQVSKSYIVVMNLEEKDIVHGTSRTYSKENSRS